MRHGKRINHLSRTSAHRKAMLANMASSLIIHKRIKTTVAKAKALRTYIEPLITKSKSDSTHTRRVVFSYLQDKEAVTELFREVSTKVAERPGGYTRIIKIGPRMGDNAEMALIELVDFNENLLDTKAKGAKKSRRRRSGGKKQEETVVAGAAAQPAAEATASDSAVEAETAEEITEEVQSVEEAPETEASEEVVEEVKVEDVKKEATPEAIEEATPEATPEAAEEATPVATEEATEEPEAEKKEDEEDNSKKE